MHVVDQHSWKRESENNSQNVHTRMKFLRKLVRNMFVVVKDFMWTMNMLKTLATNFWSVLGGDGNVYEGRGWNTHGEHTKGYNHRSICIAFIGFLSKDQPPLRQLCAAEKLIAYAMKSGKLTADYRFSGRRQLIETESPGDELYKIIMEWPHWSEDIPT